MLSATSMTNVSELSRWITSRETDFSIVVLGTGCLVDPLAPRLPYQSRRSRMGASADDDDYGDDPDEEGASAGESMGGQAEEQAASPCADGLLVTQEISSLDGEEVRASPCINMHTWFT